MVSPGQSPPRVGIVTLGCDKNTVDNEYLAALLEDAGFEVATTDPDGQTRFDAVVVTTCGFLESARAQSQEVIHELIARKLSRGNPKRVFVAGCLAQLQAQELMRTYPGIDGMVGVGQWRDLVCMIRGSGPDGAGCVRVAKTPAVRIDGFMRRRPLDRKPYAFLKISDGCNHACAFCSIPRMKGRLRSVPPEILFREARSLLDRGAREINLIAQDLSAYGMDQPGGMRLPQLLRRLCALDGDFWIRCLYFYPGSVTDEFLEVMATEPKIVPYLDLPLQHLAPTVLRRMKRPFHELNTTALVAKLRAAVPRLTLRTTLIAGFPGETMADHDRVLSGIRKLEFDRLGVFEYSREDGTPAAAMPDPVSPRIRRRRRHQIMTVQAEIARRLNSRRVGERIRALVEGYDPERRLWIGRSHAEAPEVDGAVLIKTRTALPMGEFVDARITDVANYDVLAEPL